MSRSLNSRLNKIEKALKPDPRNRYLVAIIDSRNPENSEYSYWDGTPGSGVQKITKAEFEALKHDIFTIEVISVVDDIEGVEEDEA